MMHGLRITALAASLLHCAAASTLTPPVLPLIVRNPYLSTWLTDARAEPWEKWPMFWTGEQLGLSVLALVPGASTVYPLLGRPHDSLDSRSSQYNISFPQYLGAQYDASTTNLTYRISAPSSSSSSGNNSVQVVLSFLSPITPTSTLRQAIPASYLAVHVVGDLDVSIYVDVNGQWVSGRRDAAIQWELVHDHADASRSLKTWKVVRSHEELFTEVNDRSEWGTLHFTGPAHVRHESGTSALLRHRFAASGSLRNINDEMFRDIMDDEPVFGFSTGFNLSSRPDSADVIVFTIAHLQDPVTQYASARGLTWMRPLWMSYFARDNDLIAYHYWDYEHCSLLAARYSARVAEDAYGGGSNNYKDIVELSARQVMGATSFSGTPENPILFMKEISSNGNCQTVDVIFPAFPFFLYTNTQWLAYLLEPLLEHMLSGQYPNNYTMHDLGTHFPNMTGHPDGNDEYMPVEECGDMLIMGLALLNSVAAGADNDFNTGRNGAEGDFDGAELSLEADDVSAFALAATLETHDEIGGLDNMLVSSPSRRAHKWVSRTYRLWKQWTTYLIEYALYPHNQLCTDDFAGWLALQTNLALKGIIGIKAMSELAELMGEKDEAQQYRDIANKYIREWELVGMSRDGGRAKLAYDWYGSWTTLYSLYADALLCFHPSSGNASAGVKGGATSPPDLQHSEQQPLSVGGDQDGDAGNFIPDRIYRAQSRWYSTVMQKYGLPLDSRHLYAKSDWEFQAAAVASRSTRAEILDRVALWVNETQTDRPFTDLYMTEGDGGFPDPYFFARPVVGSHFAFLALETACEGTAGKTFVYDY